MQRALRWTVVVALVAVASPAWAGKVGFVEVERAMIEVKEGQIKAKELEAWAAPRERQLEEMQNRVNELRRQLAQQQRVASAEALERLVEEELQARRRLEDSGREYQRDLESKRNEVLKEVARKINTVVTDYAKANDYDAVFIMKERTLIYLSEAANLTDIIIRLYDERFPVEG